MGYPEHWEADVVLKDGGTCHLRPITADDAPRLVAFHSRLSPQTVYYRFFAPYPSLTSRDVDRFTEVDHHDRVALVATIGDQIIGVVRYERLDADEAEVAFVIEDAHQGRGLGTVFLEHIAQAARERGIKRFTAEVLPDNARMLEVFEHAGWAPTTSRGDGYIALGFDIAPTAASLAVTHAREQRAAASSVARLVRPRTVAVVGASRDGSSLGHALVQHVVEGGFTGSVYAVNSKVEGDVVAGIRCFSSLREVPSPVDLAIVATPSDAVPDVVEAAASVGVHSLVVVSTGFGESGAEGFAVQRQLVRSARALGMRVLGPAALGFVNTDPDVSLNASLAPHLPPRGPLGFFAQSGAPGAAMLEAASRRGLGTSTFVSAGNRADISGNDLLQYWEDDDATEVVLLYLESIGNPRKFSRIARRLGARKPVVAVKTGRSTQGAPLGHAVRHTALAPDAFEQLFDQAGVIRTATVSEMYDVAELLVNQPLPHGGRVLAISNSHAMTLMAQDAVSGAGLHWIDPPIVFGHGYTSDDFVVTLAGAMDDPAVDAILALYVPELGDEGGEVVASLQHVAARGSTPVVAVEFAIDRPRLATGADPRPNGAGRVPTYPAVEDAVRALALVQRYAQWRSRADETPADVGNLDVEAARSLVSTWLRGAEDAVALTDAQSEDLLRCYGIEVWHRITAQSVDEAVGAATELGYPVVLKTVDPYLRMRSDLGGVFFDITDEDDLRRQYLARLAELGSYDYDRLVVQRQAEPGVSVVVESAEDPLFGPVLSFGLAGVSYDVMGDRAYAVPPLTRNDVDGLIERPEASALLEPPHSGPPVDREALVDLLVRVSRLADDVPELSQLVLRPVVVSPGGVSVLGATAELVASTGRTDPPARRLLG